MDSDSSPEEATPGTPELRTPRTPRRRRGRRGRRNLPSPPPVAAPPATLRIARTTPPTQPAPPPPPRPTPPAPPRPQMQNPQPAAAAAATQANAPQPHAVVGQQAAAPQAAQVTVGGMVISKATRANLTVAASLVSVRKTARAQLAPDKLQELHHHMTKGGQQDKFALMAQTISSVDDLQSTYDLHLNLQALENNLRRHDMHCLSRNRRNRSDP